MSDNGVHRSYIPSKLQALNRRTFAKTKSPKGPQWRSNKVVPAPWESSISTLFISILFFGIIGDLPGLLRSTCAFASGSLNRLPPKEIHLVVILIGNRKRIPQKRNGLACFLAMNIRYFYHIYYFYLVYSLFLFFSPTLQGAAEPKPRPRPTLSNIPPFIVGWGKIRALHICTFRQGSPDPTQYIL